MSVSSFAALGVSRPVVDALASRGITKPFPVQRLVVPAVLHGRDVLVKSPTGSGKTLAFGLPLVDRLAAHVVDELHDVAHARALPVTAVYGGTGFARQTKLAGRSHILVATPGRL